MTNKMYPNLMAEMARSGYTTADLSVATGKSLRAVQNWISGRNGISYRDCRAIRNALFPGMNVDYLFSKEPVITE